MTEAAVAVILWAAAILWCLRDASRYARRSEAAARRSEAAARRAEAALHAMHDTTKEN